MRICFLLCGNLVNFIVRTELVLIFAKKQLSHFLIQPTRTIKDNSSFKMKQKQPLFNLNLTVFLNPEAPGIDENAADVANRNLRIAAANRRIDEYNEERRRKGPRISHNWYYHMAEARLKFRLFFSLGNEGKKRFLDSYPHQDLNACSFIDSNKCCEDLFKTERDYTVERIKLYNTVFMQEKCSFSSFYARLSAQTALCNWPLDQERAILKVTLLSNYSLSCVKSYDR